MSRIQLRLSSSAFFVMALALSGRVCAQSQSFGQSVNSLHADLSAATTLPDAPSWSSSSSNQSSSSQQTPQQVTPQQQVTPPANETEAQRKERERAEAERQVKEELTQRAGGVIPIFTVVMNGQQTVPLTPKEKFVISFHTIIDPYTIGLAAVVGGGYGELTDDHTGYGHGAAGYFKRVGASYADNVIGNVVGNAMLPVVLHQDPRYFRKGSGSIKSRVLYSAITTFVCHGDNGKRQFNASNVLGNFIAGGISNAYYPADERGVGLTISNASVVTLEGMVGAQLLEFSPDINELLKRRHQRKLDAKAAKAAAAAGTATPPPTKPQP